MKNRFEMTNAMTMNPKAGSARSPLRAASVAKLAVGLWRRARSDAPYLPVQREFQPRKLDAQWNHEPGSGNLQVCPTYAPVHEEGMVQNGIFRVLALLLTTLTLSVHAGPPPPIPIISFKHNHLAYDKDASGNRVPDFSTCGYVASDRSIPDAPVRVVVSPIKGDETALIQKAIDYVAGLPTDENGIRGAVLLLRGRHEVDGQLQLTNSGVVLRGQGMNDGGTVLVAAGTGRRTLIQIEGQKDFTVHSNPGWTIADNYVPVGAMSFHVKDANGLKVGDTIRITRPSTRAWIDTLDANEFGGGEGDWRLVWHPGSYDLVWDRVIKQIDGNQI
ncbi:MAG TPA: hypothetical protein VFF11_02140, partial [Candidatus Binatia bacterium]|nr:hypothetical protein [Candidatus Binatia bacterium]